MYFLLYSILVILFLISAGYSLHKTISYVDGNTNAFKKILLISIVVSIIFQTFHLVKTSSKIFVFFNIFIQGLFILLYNEYPRFYASDIRFITALVCTFISHIIFTCGTTIKQIHGFHILSTYVFIWITPLLFIISLNGNEDLLDFGASARTFSSRISDVLENISKKKKNELD